MCLYVQSCGSMLYSWTLNVLLIFSLEDLSNGESEILKLFHCYYISPFMPFSVYLMRLIGIIFSALNIYNYYVLLTSCTLTKMLQPHYGQRSREAHCRSSPLPPLLQIQSLSLIPSSVADNLTTCCGLSFLSAPTSSRSMGSFTPAFFLSTHFFVPDPNSSRHSLETCQPSMLEKQGGQEIWWASFSSLTVLFSESPSLLPSPEADYLLWPLLTLWPYIQVTKQVSWWNTYFPPFLPSVDPFGLPLKGHSSPVSAPNTYKHMVLESPGPYLSR